MGIVASLLAECCVRCKVLLSIADRDVTQDSHDELAERLAHLELLTRRYQLQPGGRVAALTAEPPARPREQ